MGGTCKTSGYLYMGSKAVRNFAKGAKPELGLRHHSYNTMDSGGGKCEEGKPQFTRFIRGKKGDYCLNLAYYDKKGQTIFKYVAISKKQYNKFVKDSENHCTQKRNSTFYNLLTRKEMEKKKRLEFEKPSPEVARIRKGIRKNLRLRELNFDEKLHQIIIDLEKPLASKLNANNSPEWKKTGDIINALAEAQCGRKNPKYGDVVFYLKGFLEFYDRFGLPRKDVVEAIAYNYHLLYPKKSMPLDCNKAVEIVNGINRSWVKITVKRLEEVVLKGKSPKQIISRLSKIYNRLRKKGIPRFIALIESTKKL